MIKLTWTLLLIAALVAAIGASAQARLVSHDVASEIALVEAHLRAGEFRSAVTYAAHVAGEHPDSLEGARLYAWLLRLEGQGAMARKLGYDEAPFADPVLAPQPGAQDICSDARVTGNGVLFDGGARALVPIASIESDDVLLRNALGEMSRVDIEQWFPKQGVAVLRLERSIPVDGELEVAHAVPYPGSAAFAVGFGRAGNFEAAWPLLASGFVGKPGVIVDSRTLDAALLVGGGEGAVFDRTGRLVGLALADGANAARLVSVAATVPSAAPPVAEPAVTVAPVERIYESALRSTVQVLVTHKHD